MLPFKKNQTDPRATPEEFFRKTNNELDKRNDKLTTELVRSLKDLKSKVGTDSYLEALKTNKQKGVEFNERAKNIDDAREELKAMRLKNLNSKKTVDEKKEQK